MPKFTVVWDGDLEADFILAWTNADSETRALLTYASNWADKGLSRRPESWGQPVEGEAYRIVIVPGATSTSRSVEIIFEVFAADALVRILNFRLRD
jgi:hypothetical protein